jgi:uncharacterized protein (TIGR03435 family)
MRSFRTSVALQVAALLAVFLNIPPSSPAFATDLLNQAAPALLVEEVLTGQEPEALTWDSLRGRAVVMELWATWCGPCVASQKHWNRLVDEFQDQPVEFVSLSDEDGGVVREFLQKQPLKGWVALDQDRSFFDALKVQGIPRTVLVDREGMLRAVTTPLSVTSDTIENLLDGRPLKLNPPAEEHAEIALGVDGEPLPLLQISVRPSTAHASQVRMSDGAFEATGFTVPEMLTFAYQVPEPRLIVEADLPKDRYDFELGGTRENCKDLQALAQTALEYSFGLVPRTSTREMEVLILGRRDGVEPRLEPAKSDARGSILKPGHLAANGVTLVELAGSLERLLQRPVVVDAEGLDGQYQIELEWDPEAEGSLNEAVSEELGLELSTGRRDVQVWLVERRRSTDPDSILVQRRTDEG